jgi:hypothetical protein
MEDGLEGVRLNPGFEKGEHGTWTVGRGKGYFRARGCVRTLPINGLGIRRDFIRDEQRQALLRNFAQFRDLQRLGGLTSPIDG